MLDLRELQPTFRSIYFTIVRNKEQNTNRLEGNYKQSSPFAIESQKLSRKEYRLEEMSLFVEMQAICLASVPKWYY